MTTALAPALAEQMAGGDGGLLRRLVTLFEAEGFRIAGAHEIVPELVVAAGLLAGSPPNANQRRDAARGRAILAALSPVDIGQAAVVEGGLCLGIETLQGTDALLRFVAGTPDRLRCGTGGVLVKWPKSGQDLRVDMPAIGPATVGAAVAAGLSGIAIAAGAVLVLGRDEVVLRAEAAGLSAWAENRA